MDLSEPFMVDVGNALNWISTALENPESPLISAMTRQAEAMERIAHTLERIEQEAVTFRRDTTHMLSQINSGVRSAKR